MQFVHTNFVELSFILRCDQHLELLEHDVDIGAFLNDMVPMLQGRFIKVGVKRFL